MDLVPGGSSISCVLPDSTLTNIPWRRLNVKYANSEIYFDIIEEMDAIYDRYAAGSSVHLLSARALSLSHSHAFNVSSNGMLVKSVIAGEIQVQCHLSGVPDMTMRWVNPRLIDDASFHPCVRYSRWDRERVVSFVPPDGDFRLMTYRYDSTRERERERARVSPFAIYRRPRRPNDDHHAPALALALVLVWLDRICAELTNKSKHQCIVNHNLPSTRPPAN